MAQEKDRPLSPRQLEILRLMPTMAQKEIARELGISKGTVKNIQAQIYKKFKIWGARESKGAKRTRAVLIGISRGLIDLDSIVFSGEGR